MIEIDFQEKDIEEYLCRNGNLTKWFPNLVVVKQQFKIFDFYIDILAYDKERKCFVIIELKKGELNASAAIQALRYKECMKRKYYRHRFYILLLGHNLNPELNYFVKRYDPSIISYTYNVYYKLYDYSFEEGINFNYICTSQVKTEDYLDKLQARMIEKRETQLENWSKNYGNISKN